MRPTPHLLIAASTVLVAVILAVPTLVAWGAAWPAPVREVRLAAAPAATVTAERLREPVVPGIGAPERDPFTLRSGGGGNANDVLPPPPVAFPDIPVLPIPER
jgi:hypothetical protein